MLLPCPYCQKPIDCSKVTPGQVLLCPYCRGRLQAPGGAPPPQSPLQSSSQPSPSRSLPPAGYSDPTPAQAPPRAKPKADADGFIQISPRTTLLVVGGLVLLVVVTLGFLFLQQESERRAADLKAGIIPAERELAKRIAMERVHFYLGEKAPLFNEPRAEFIGSRGKYYKIHGKVRAFLGKEERWVHNYTVELRLDPSVPEGYVCHSVFVGGTSLYSNYYVEPRR